MSDNTFTTRRLIVSESLEENFFDRTWTVYLKKEPDTLVGKICFTGGLEKGVCEMKIEIEPDFRKNNYLADAIAAVRDRAYKAGAIEIYVHLDFMNTAVKDNLMGSGFHVEKRELTEKEDRVILVFKSTKPSRGMKGIFFCVGVAAGYGLGKLIGHSSICIVAGLVLGLIVGAILDSREKREREAILGRDNPEA